MQPLIPCEQKDKKWPSLLKHMITNQISMQISYGKRSTNFLVIFHWLLFCVDKHFEFDEIRWVLTFTDFFVDLEIKN